MRADGGICRLRGELLEDDQGPAQSLMKTYFHVLIFSGRSQITHLSIPKPFFMVFIPYGLNYSRTQSTSWIITSWSQDSFASQDNTYLQAAVSFS